MVKYYVLVKKTGAKQWTAAIATKPNAKASDLMKLKTRKGYSKKVITKAQLDAYMKGILNQNKKSLGKLRTAIKKKAKVRKAKKGKRKVKKAKRKPRTKKRRATKAKIKTSKRRKVKKGSKRLKKRKVSKKRRK